ncbi:hypothetical protein F4802DRAFT_583977 [Xylaria palmicola]|nr:hypothetical protein F4802DRAFT_583977 [Xylaria palmicola]
MALFQHWEAGAGMHWEHDTEFGQHVDRLLYCQNALLIHVPRRSTFLQVCRAMVGRKGKPPSKRGERITNDWHHLEWFEDADLDSPESSQQSEQSGHTASTAKSNPSPTGGFVALNVRVNIHEKRRSDLPTCFILGRGHIADLRLDGSASSTLARHQLAIGLMGGYWAVQNLAKGYVTLEDDSLHRGQTVVLHPDRRNSFRVGRPADPIEFHVYCYHPGVIRHVSGAPGIFETGVMRPIESSEGTTITAITDAGPPASGGAPRMHFLEHQPLPSRTAIPKIHALDADTADVYIAKEYPLPCENMLAKRYGLLEPLRGLSPSSFLPDRRVIEYDGKIYSLILKQDGIIPLAALDEILEYLGEAEYLSAGRRLLWDLLRTIGKLHQLGIAHADICQHTVLVDQCGDVDRVFLGGFSEAVPLDVDRAREDCFQAFAEVRRFVGAVAKLPPSWLGNETLERILNENAIASAATWPYTVEDICHDAQIDLETSTEKWTSIRAMKEILIRHSIQAERIMVNFEDIREYMVVEAVRGTLPTLELDPARDIVLSALDRCRPADGEEFVSVESVLDLCKRLSRKHRKMLAAIDLFTSLERLKKGRRLSQLIILPVYFTIPYNIRYGLISLTRLRSLAAPGFDPEQLRPLVDRCYEVRGSCNGIFVPYETFNSAADMLDIKYNGDQLFERSENSAAAFTYPS